MENFNSIYSDAHKIYFNYDNICLDFLSKEDGQVNFLGRIKLSPQSARELNKALSSNIKKYEEIYGRINKFDEKAKEKEEEARKIMLEQQNEKIEKECDRLERMLQEKVQKMQLLQKELEK